jgi:hypothetical protein
MRNWDLLSASSSSWNLWSSWSSFLRYLSTSLTIGIGFTNFSLAHQRDLFDRKMCLNKILRACFTSLPKNELEGQFGYNKKRIPICTNYQVFRPRSERAKKIRILGSGSTTLLPALTHSTRRRCESSRLPRQSPLRQQII